jgi:enamine deaminase RidA (YjgF/YER057c/UK114 family)
MDIRRIETSPRLSRAVICNGIVYLSGLTARERDTGIAGQTRQVLDRIDEELAKAGSHKSRILFAQIFMKDIKADFPGMNVAWEAWMPAGCAPARSTVEAVLALRELLLEVVITAQIGAGAVQSSALDPRYAAIHVQDGF